MADWAARRADPDVVAAALRRAAEHGPFFVVDVSGSGQGAGDGTVPGPRRTGAGSPLAELYGPAGRVDLEEMVDHHARRLRTSERRVTASLLFAGIAARLWSPVLGCAAHGVIPDLDPARLRWQRGSPLGLSTDRPAGWEAGDPAAQVAPAAHAVLDAHLRPLVGALRGLVRISEGLLWGNAASALVGAAQVAGGPGAIALVRGLLAREPLRGTMTTGTGEPSWRRRSCCLYYRVPGGGMCGDCALHDAGAAGGGTGSGGTGSGGSGSSKGQ